MTTRERLLQAREHIRAKEFGEARIILEAMDHPKAREWLQRIDALQPVPEINIPARGQSCRRFYVAGALGILILIIAVSFGIFLVSNNTTDIPLALQELNKPRHYPLSEYFPSDTTVYSVMRVDDDQIQTLDNLFIHIQSFIRSPLTTPFLGDEPFSLSQSLDQMTDVLFQEDFDIAIRPWLGDWVAIGVFNVVLDVENFNPSADVGTLIVIEITDREKAISFIEKLTEFDPNQTFTRTESADYTIFNSNEWENNNILIDDSALMIASDYAMAAVQDGFESLIATNPAFIETMALLPEDEYSIIAFFDFEPIARAIFEMTQAVQQSFAEVVAQSPNSSLPLSFTTSSYDDFLPDGVTMDDVMSAFGDLAIGFTIVDEYTLMFDSAQNPENIEIMNFNVTLPDLQPADPSFLRFVPEDVAMFAHGTDIKSQIEVTLAAGQMQLDILERNPELLEQYRQLGFTTAQDEIDRIDAIIEPETGLTVIDDIFGWMTGDYVIFAKYDPHHKSMFFSYYYPEQELKQNLEVGMIIEVNDRNHVQNLIDSLGSAIPMIVGDMELTVSKEMIGESSVAVIHVPLHNLLIPPLDFVIGVNDEVLVIATRDIATQLLTGDGGFNESPSYSAVQTRWLPDSNSRFYMGNDGVNLIGDVMFGLLPPYFERTVTDLNTQLEIEPPPPIVDEEQRKSLPLMIPPMRMILAMFESVTTTVSIDDDYRTVSRMTLTFAD